MTGELRRPLRGPRIVTQVWGPTTWTAEPPAFGHAHFHLGVDYAAKCDEFIYAPGDGHVIYAGWDDTGYGLCLWLAHPGGLSTVLAHIKEVLASPPDLVKQGDAIARVGSTGNSTGCHLHFGVTKDGIYIPPAGVMNLGDW